MEFSFCLIVYYSDNYIGDEGAKYLSNSLQYNSSLVLKYWCFLFDSCSDNEINTEGA